MLSFLKPLTSHQEQPSFKTPLSWRCLVQLTTVHMHTPCEFMLTTWEPLWHKKPLKPLPMRQAHLHHSLPCLGQSLLPAERWAFTQLPPERKLRANSCWQRKTYRNSDAAKTTERALQHHGAGKDVFAVTMPFGLWHKSPTWREKQWFMFPDIVKKKL